MVEIVQIILSVLAAFLAIAIWSCTGCLLVYLVDPDWQPETAGDVVVAGLLWPALFMLSVLHQRSIQQQREQLKREHNEQR